jgi:hypothetical protein
MEEMHEALLLLKRLNGTVSCYLCICRGVKPRDLIRTPVETTDAFSGLLLWLILNHWLVKIMARSYASTQAPTSFDHPSQPYEQDGVELNEHTSVHCWPMFVYM